MLDSSILLGRPYCGVCDTLSTYDGNNDDDDDNYDNGDDDDDDDDDSDDDDDNDDDDDFLFALNQKLYLFKIFFRFFLKRNFCVVDLNCTTCF